MATSRKFIRSADDVQAAFDAEVASVLKSIYDNERDAAKDARRTLRELHGAIEDRLKGLNQSEFSVLRLAAIQRDIGRWLSQFSDEMTGQMNGSLSRSFDLGIAIVDEPLKAARLVSSFAAIDRQLILTLSTFSANLISNLTEDARQSINQILQQTASGILTVDQASARVGTSLESDGIFRGIAARAESIVRTETLRIYSIADQERKQVNAPLVAQAGYRLGKFWLTAQDERVRSAHKDADGQSRQVHERFEVGGELLLYPRDPAASAANTILCRCAAPPTIAKLDA